MVVAPVKIVPVLFSEMVFVPKASVLNLAIAGVWEHEQLAVQLPLLQLKEQIF